MADGDLMQNSRRLGSSVSTVFWLLATAVGILGLSVLARPGTPTVATNSPLPAAPEQGISVAELLKQRQKGTLQGVSVTVSGYWSGLVMPVSCRTSDDAQPIELACVNGQYGVTDVEEPLLYRDRSGWHMSAVERVTPYIPSQELLERALMSDVPGPEQYLLARAITLVGHFDDPEADRCAKERQQACRDQFVLDEIVSLDEPRFATVNRMGQKPNDAAVFDRATCSGDVAYSYEGWTSISKLGVLDAYPDDLVFARLTESAVSLGDLVEEDSEGRRPYRLFGRQLCFARSYRPGTIEVRPVGDAYRQFEDNSTEPVTDLLPGQIRPEDVAEGTQP